MKPLAICLLLTLIATQSFAASKKPTNTCAAIVFSSAASETYTSRIGIVETSDLDVWVLFDAKTKPKWTETHTLEVQAYTPNGFLYQSLSIPITTDEDKKDKTAVLDGYPGEKKYTILKEKIYKGNKHLGALVRVPLAGTAVVNSGIYGVWHFDAIVDDEPAVCTSTTEIQITP